MVLTSITDPILYFPYKPHWDHILTFDGRKPQLGALHCCRPSLGSSFSYHKKKKEKQYMEARYISNLHTAQNQSGKQKDTRKIPCLAGIRPLKRLFLSRWGMNLTPVVGLVHSVENCQ